MGPHPGGVLVPVTRLPIRTSSDFSLTLDFAAHELTLKCAFYLYIPSACCVLPREAFVAAWLSATGRDVSIKSAKPACSITINAPGVGARDGSNFVSNYRGGIKFTG